MQLGPFDLGRVDGRAERAGRLRALGGRSVSPTKGSDPLFLPGGWGKEDSGCVLGSLALQPSPSHPTPTMADIIERHVMESLGFRQFRDILSGLKFLPITDLLCDLGHST